MGNWSFRVNEKSVSGKLSVPLDKAERKLKDMLREVSDSLIGTNPETDGIGAGSPVDTGAYITSHSFQPTGGRGGRSRTSKRKPKNQSWQAKADEARRQLYNDIEVVDVSASQSGIFRNRAPHATAVEKKHNVYRKTKDRFR
mgnify:CR=1 FL=1